MEQDFLLAVNGSDYQLVAADPPKKSGSFVSLVNELFDGASPAPMEVDIMQDYAIDSQSTQDKLTQWQQPDVEQQLQQQQQQSITSPAHILEGELKCLQVTQTPQVLCVQREGATRESVPHLPGDVLPREHQVPALAIFDGARLRQPPPPQPAPLQQLEIGDIEQLLSPGSSSPDAPSFAEATPTVESTAKVETTHPVAPVGDFQLSRKVKFISDTIGRYHGNGAVASSNGKVQVHEVVMVLLMADHLGADEGSLNNILTFCTEEGTATERVSDNFMAKDTKAMGLVWQKIKSNKNGNYDTFARAMRVGRERSKEYFDYLDAGKGAKKRIYKLGPKCRKELDRMKKVLQV